MLQEVMFSGFGGQGVLTIAKNLAYTAMLGGKEVCWMPTYGPEMRGGTANCTVVVSDDEIGSPTALHPTAVIAMTLPTLDKYEPMIKPGGYLIVNENMVNRAGVRDDIHVLMVPASKIAQEIGNERAHFEAAFPQLPVFWLDTSAGSDQVLLLTRTALLQFL